MALIDPDGLFNGDRMAKLSDSAKLAWPYFWCASNTVGRIELNYRKFVGRAFHHFSNPPTEQQFWDWAREYRDNFLLFIYKQAGQVWGQWDVSERLLPKHKLAVDLRTPPPDHESYTKWREDYIRQKQSALDGNFNDANDSEKISETFGGERHGIGDGVGVVVGIGKTFKEPAPVIEIPKNENPSKNDDDKNPEPPKPSAAKPVFASHADELVALVKKATGELPDRKLVDTIRQTLELRGATLRAYLDDIEPRLGRLKNKPGPGFFHDHAKKFGGYDQQPIIANEIRGPCCKFGVRPDGSPCDCQTGRELVRVTERIEREKAAMAVEKTS